MSIEPQIIEVYLTEDTRLEIRNGSQSSLDGPVDIAISPGASVCWQFSGLGDQQSWTPNIVFPSGSPFASTRLSADAFVGFDNQGDPGSFEFIATLQDNRFPRLSRIISSPAQIWQEAESVDVEIDLENGIFSVAPKSISIVEETPVLWRFKGLEPHFRPSIFFTSFIPEGRGQERILVENYFGPFADMTWGPDGLTGSGTSGIRGQFFYLVRLVSAGLEDRVLSLEAIHSIDPDVDNEKDPAASDPEPRP